MLDLNNYTLKCEVPERIDLALKDIAHLESSQNPTFLERQQIARIKQLLKMAKDICKELTR